MSWKVLWNCVVNSQETWPNPATPYEFILHNSNMYCFICVLVVIGMVIIDIDDVIARRRSARELAEAQESVRLFKVRSQSV